MGKDVCLTCRHFHQSGALFGAAANVKIACELGPGGECRLNPPIVPLGYDGKHDTLSPAVYPIVFASYWCGKHERRHSSALTDQTEAAAHEVAR